MVGEPILTNETTGSRKRRHLPGHGETAFSHSSNPRRYSPENAPGPKADRINSSLSLGERGKTSPDSWRAKAVEASFPPLIAIRRFRCTDSERGPMRPRSELRLHHRVSRTWAGKLSSASLSAARFRGVFSQNCSAPRFNSIPSITTYCGSVIEHRSIRFASAT